MCDGLVDQREPGLRRPGVHVRPALDEPDERPEDRRRPQVLVLVDPVGDLARGPPSAGRARSSRRRAGTCRAPARSAGRSPRRRARRARRASRDELWLASPEMEEPRVEQAVGERVRMVELGRERDRAVGALDGPIRVAEEPQEEPRRRQARHPRRRSRAGSGAAGSRRSRTPGSPGRGSPALPASCPLNPVSEPRMKLPSTRMLGVVLGIGQPQDLVRVARCPWRTRRGTRGSSRGSAGPGRAAAPRRGPRRAPAPRVGVLGLAGVAAQQGERPGQARPQRELLSASARGGPASPPGRRGGRG